MERLENGLRRIGFNSVPDELECSAKGTEYQYFNSLQEAKDLHSKTNKGQPRTMNNNDAAATADESERPPPLQVFQDPRNDPDCFPQFDVFMRALQDPGETSSVKCKNKQASSGSDHGAVIVYPKLMKGLSGVQRVLQAKYSHLGIPKHTTDCKRQLALACVRTRKSRDKATVPDEFRKYAVEGSDTLFIINHNLSNGGFNIPLSACLDHWHSQKKKDVDCRSSNDACRVAAILLLPEFRESVAKIMSEKKDRAMLDQAVCPVSAFYEVAAEKFRDVSFRAPFPEKFSLIDGYETIDPNDEERIQLEGRDGAWFKATWEVYLRQKYRKTLSRWWSQTGGGGGEVENFQNYCPFREKWLTYVYMLDVEASLLLASNASSAVPKELLNEAGGHQRLTSCQDGKKATNRLSGATLIQATEECSRNINRVADLMATLVEKKTSPPNHNHDMTTPITMSSTPPTIPKKRSLVDCLDDVRRLREHEQQIMDDIGVSPATKQLILNKIQQEKKKVMTSAANNESI